jgi:hypothetical protein
MVKQGFVTRTPFPRPTTSENPHAELHLLTCWQSGLCRRADGPAQEQTGTFKFVESVSSSTRQRYVLHVRSCPLNGFV